MNQHEPIEDLIERSSLGSLAARDDRALTPADAVARILARAQAWQWLPPEQAEGQEDASPSAPPMATVEFSYPEITDEQLASLAAAGDPDARSEAWRRLTHLVTVLTSSAAESHVALTREEEIIARALAMAHRIANQTVEEARARAKTMIGEAEARAAATIEHAREVTEAAQARAQKLTEGLETRYKERIQSAEARARVAEEQSRMQIAQVAEQVARRRQELESSIDGLRAFERDYRARLRGFVQGQLKALEAAAPSGPVAPPQPPGLGGGSRPLPGSEDLPALSTGVRPVNSSYSALRDPTIDEQSDRVERLRHDN